MPAYPFILLGVILVAVVVLPPLVAAFIDDRNRSRMVEGGVASDDGRPPGPADHASREEAEELASRRDGRRG